MSYSTSNHPPLHPLSMQWSLYTVDHALSSTATRQNMSALSPTSPPPPQPFFTRERLDLSRPNRPAQPPRPLKRRMTTIEQISGSSAPRATPPPPPRAQSFTTAPGAHNQVPLPVDPIEGQPGVTILRTPLEPGVNYMYLHNNPSFFLLASDFGGLYPVTLEPPRGMCCKERAPLMDGNASETLDGSQTFKPDDKLRCPFCRRSYGGSNGRSMWRRHVWDKHKVGMSNRRELVRASSSTDENLGRQPAKRPRIEPPRSDEIKSTTLKLSQSHNLPLTPTPTVVPLAEQSLILAKSPSLVLEPIYEAPQRPHTPPPPSLRIPPPTPPRAEPQWVHAPPEEPQCLRPSAAEFPHQSTLWTTLCEGRESTSWSQQFLISAADSKQAIPDLFNLITSSPLPSTSNAPNGHHKRTEEAPAPSPTTTSSFHLTKATWREETLSPITSPEVIASKEHSRDLSEEIFDFLAPDPILPSPDFWCHVDLDAVVRAGMSPVKHTSPSFSPGGHLMPL